MIELALYAVGGFALGIIIGIRVESRRKFPRRRHDSRTTHTGYWL